MAKQTTTEAVGITKGTVTKTPEEEVVVTPATAPVAKPVEEAFPAGEVPADKKDTVFTQGPDDEGGKEAGEDTPAGTAKPQGGADANAGADAELQALAKEYGLTDSEAKSFGNPGALRAAVSVIDRRFAEIGRSAFAPAGGQSQQPSFGVPPQRQQVPQGEEPPPPSPGKTKLSRDKYEDELVDEFEAQAAEIHQLRQMVSGILGHVGQETIKSQDRAFEDELGALPAEYQEVFGVGAGAEMDQTGEQFRNRCELYQQLQAMKRGMQAMGQKVPSHKVLFKRALGSLFGVQAQTIERRKIAESLKRDEAGKFIGRPAGRTATRPTGANPTERAIHAVAAKLRDYGADEY